MADRVRISFTRGVEFDVLLSDLAVIAPGGVSPAQRLEGFLEDPDLAINVIEELNWEQVRLIAEPVPEEVSQDLSFKGQLPFCCKELILDE